MKLLLSILLVPFVLGCTHGGGFSVTRADINMETGSTTQQTLLVGATKIPVDVEQKIAPDKVVERINSHGEEFEEEQYHLSNNGLDLIKASDAVFTAPLPLLKFPASAGQTSTWSGVVQEGATTRAATAEVVSSADELKTNPPLETIKVTVNLSLNSGGPVPAKRKLEFWFSRAGLIKRAFDLGTTRSAISE